MFEKILKGYELKRALTFFIASSLSLQVLHGLDFVQLWYMYVFFWIDNYGMYTKNNYGTHVCENRNSIKGFGL